MRRVADKFDETHWNGAWSGWLWEPGWRRSERGREVGTRTYPVARGPDRLDHTRDMTRTGGAAPGRWVLHMLIQAAARLPMFRKEEDCAALERVLLEARGRHLRGTAQFDCGTACHAGARLAQWVTEKGELVPFSGPQGR